MHFALRIIAVAVFSVLAGVFPLAALADDWEVIKLRGIVLQLAAGDWVPLERGMVVSDDRPLRTLASGRAELQRGNERISLGPNTQVQIHDRTGKQFTTVQQYFGTVSVEAEVRDVQHFAVQTPFLAAVVKGTRFEVRSSEAGCAVEVLRGQVAVEERATGANVLVAAGQQARIGPGEPFAVSGKGVLPVIRTSEGEVSGSDGVTVTTGPDDGHGQTGAPGLRLGVNKDKGERPDAPGLRLDVGNGAGTNVGVGVGGGAGVQAGVQTPVGNVGVGVSGGGGVQVSVGGLSLGLGGN